MTAFVLQNNAKRPLFYNFPFLRLNGKRAVISCYLKLWANELIFAIDLFAGFDAFKYSCRIVLYLKGKSFSVFFFCFKPKATFCFSYANGIEGCYGSIAIALCFYLAKVAAFFIGWDVHKKSDENKADRAILIAGCSLYLSWKVNIFGLIKNAHL